MARMDIRYAALVLFTGGVGGAIGSRVTDVVKDQGMVGVWVSYALSFAIMLCLMLPAAWFGRRQGWIAPRRAQPPDDTAETDR